MINQEVTGSSFIQDMISITFEVSYLCDKTCWYCYNPKKRYFGIDEQMKDQIWEDILNIKEPLQLLLMGGETTLYKKSIEYYNSFCNKFKDDNTKSIIYFTHGNNTNSTYQQFDSFGKKEAYISFSYHGKETNLELLWKNINITSKKNNIVSCLIAILEDKNDTKDKLQLLKDLTENGYETDFYVLKDNNSNLINGDISDFEQFKYQSKIISGTRFFNKDTELLFLSKNDFFNYFKNGLNSSKKICKNKLFTINPNGIISAECLMGDTLQLPSKNFHEFILSQTIVCDRICNSIGAVTNKKTFFKSKLEDI